MGQITNLGADLLGPTGMSALRIRLPLPSDRIPLGNTGLMVSPLCLGMAEDPATVLAAWESGINFFFLSSDLHWPNYEGTRRGLARLLAQDGIRDQIVVATACYLTQPEFCGPFLEVLEAVPGLERIDMLVGGGAYGHEVLRRLPAYERDREKGHYGARNRRLLPRSERRSRIGAQWQGSGPESSG